MSKNIFIDWTFWALIGVVSLHAGIIWLVSREPTPDLLVRNKTTPLITEGRLLQPIEPPSVVTVNRANEAGNVGDTASIPRAVSAPRKPYGSAQFTSAKAIKFRNPISPSYTTNSAAFADTIIWVRRHAVVEKQSNGEKLNPMSPPKEPVLQPKRNRRTIFSRAVPVIKKPYEWLKTLVSKL